MLSVLTTTTALLDELFDTANDVAWQAFNARYQPILHAFARRLGVSEADAADVAQETLVRFVKDYRAGKYDRSKGRLRSWIISIAKYRVADLRHDTVRRRQVRGDSVLVDLPDENHLNAIWEEECLHAIVHHAMAELRERGTLDSNTISVFERTTFDECTTAEVAAEFEMTPNAVYKVKRRCLAQLRLIMARLMEAYEL